LQTTYRIVTMDSSVSRYDYTAPPWSYRTMRPEADGLSIARVRILAERENRTGFLDLGRLGLTEVPAELFDLIHLRGLNWGNRWRDEEGDWNDAASNLGLNEHADLLAALQRLPALTFLSLMGSGIADLSPLAALRSLQSLACSYTHVGDLSPLAALRSLQSLDCSWTLVGDLSPLAELHSLQWLNCSHTEVGDLSPLAGLRSLQWLNCGGTRVCDLSPLGAMYSLRSLDCLGTQVGDLSPLAGLRSLRSLDCWYTKIGDLSPLAGLRSLQSLDCSYTEVGDLAPLAGLHSLQSLNCSNTQVVDLSPLAGLHSLQSLNCSYTQVVDLSPLVGLHSVKTLRCVETWVSHLPTELVWLDSLQELYLSGDAITEIPVEVLSPDPRTNCLESLRAHLRDLAAGEVLLPDVKVLVLGNGRIGKTQICRRLGGHDFEPNADSTHGISVMTAQVAMPQPADEPACLHLWDFGGQDLYHGTHALFMRTRSLFLLVWTPQSENETEHEYRGVTFRNHRLAYWLEFVRHTSGLDSPILIIQNMCDTPEDEARCSPVLDKALTAFRFKRELYYSALHNRNRPTLDDALQQAVGWLFDRLGQVRIGKGRLAVRRKLEALRNEDAALPAGERKYRTLTQDHFQAICAEAGGVSDPALLLEYLHHAGIVFYRAGLFDDRIVLDQGWALDAVYAVFHREKCYRHLWAARGRFTRSLLEALVWGEYSVAEQELFLSLMESCGICFKLRDEDRQRGLEVEYIAPDLLPDRDLLAVEIEAMWGEGAQCSELVVELPFLHPGAMRGIISRLGRKAGLSALYWKYGICLYEQTTQSRALIEEQASTDPTTWSGRIVVRAQGGQSADLLRRLQDWIEEDLRRLGCRDWVIKAAPHAPHAARARRPGRRGADQPAAEDDIAEAELRFSQPPADAVVYCVSYAWNDDSKAIVDRLCQEAENRQKRILRDTTGLGLGERISRFMQKLGAGDRVFVILSDKYLKSPYCMYELFEVWRTSKMAEEEFCRRVRAFRLPDARMSTPLERAHCAKYWLDQFTELDQLVRQVGPSLLGKADFERYKLMLVFAHHVGDILALIADTLQPADFEQLAQHGFDDVAPIE